jgi:hypothetical protein
MVAGAVILDPADLVAADQRAARPPVLEVGLEKAPNRSAAQLPRPAGGKDPHLVADHHGMRVGPSNCGFRAATETVIASATPAAAQ